MLQSTLIPVNTEGKENDLETRRNFDTESEASSCFDRACKRLLMPASWQKITGALSADFELVDGNGKSLNRPAAMGDLVRIDIPGPGLSTGGGYDWVEVDAIERKGSDREELCGMRLRPTAAPGESAETAHFFRSKASSTFIIRRMRHEVVAEYHGRNELPNMNLEKTTDNLRNAVITSGALAGLSELQWKALINAFLVD